MTQPSVAITFANIKGRAALVVDVHSTGGGRAVDIERATNGAFGHQPMHLFSRWNELREIVPTLRAAASEAFVAGDLRAPAPEPRQVFGIGLNYRAHAAETGVPIPDSPLTFTKFSSSINAPHGDIRIDVPSADWEIEVVAVVGSGGRKIPESSAWDSIAGICVGQDISDRVLQRATQPPQFGLGKSREGYAPFGPWLVDVASLSNRDALPLTCTLNGEIVQQSNSNDLIFSIPQLIAYLSSIVELFPGDVIFTGTPSGVGAARKPPRFLASGDVLVSTIDGVGSITNRCV
jgi:2-keto-4-pentenoate hydratase/2-oxohepta-3-ene-1,7-dioic acid hydratase in catechol pathway